LQSLRSHTPVAELKVVREKDLEPGKVRSGIAHQNKKKRFVSPKPVVVLCAQFALEGRAGILSCHGTFVSLLLGDFVREADVLVSLGPRGVKH
jgi:hypothetical protein